MSNALYEFQPGHIHYADRRDLPYLERDYFARADGIPFDGETVDVAVVEESNGSALVEWSNGTTPRWCYIPAGEIMAGRAIRGALEAGIPCRR